MVVAIICAVQLIIGMSHLQHRGEKASLVWCEASGQIVNLLVSGGTFVVVFVVVEARTPRIDCMASFIDWLVMTCWSVEIDPL